MGTGTEIEDIFEDGLLSVFGDVKVSHGAPGQVFSYPTQAHGYLPYRTSCLANLVVQHPQIAHRQSLHL